MREPSHHQPRQPYTPTFSIALHDVRTGPPYDGELGAGVLLRTDRGDIQALLHPSPEAQHGVIWVGGARHSRQDKLEIIEDEGILHEVKHFPYCLQEKYPCSCP